MKATCPICKKENLEYFESSHKEPFVHTIPMVGLTIYGMYSTEKYLICQSDEFIHFGFQYADDERLVKLGVENPQIEKEYFESLSENDGDYDDEPDDNWDDEDEYSFEPCCDCDLPDACADFGCAIKNGIKEPYLPF